VAGSSSRQQVKYWQSPPPLPLLPSKKQSWVLSSSLSPGMLVAKLDSSSSAPPVHSMSQPSIWPSPSSSQPLLHCGRPLLALQPGVPSLPAPPSPSPTPPSAPWPPPSPSSWTSSPQAPSTRAAQTVSARPAVIQEENRGVARRGRSMNIPVVGGAAGEVAESCGGDPAQARRASAPAWGHGTTAYSQG
jgi:hypothetical protein